MASHDQLMMTSMDIHSSNLTCDITLKKTKPIKELAEQMFHKPAPKQVLTDQQITANIVLTKNEPEQKQPQAQSIQPAPTLPKHPV